MKLFSKHPRQPAVYQHEFHVLRIWSIILIAFFVGLIGSAMLHVMIFTWVSDEQLFGLETSEPAGGEVVSATRINTAADSLTKRREAFNGVGSETMPVDPS